MWTLVQIFWPYCKYLYSGENIHTPVEIFIPQWKYFNLLEIFLPQWKYFYPGWNIYTPVEIFIPLWKYLNPGGNILTEVAIENILMPYVGRCK